MCLTRRFPVNYHVLLILQFYAELVKYCLGICKYGDGRVGIHRKEIRWSSGKLFFLWRKKFKLTFHQLVNFQVIVFYLWSLTKPCCLWWNVHEMFVFIHVLSEVEEEEVISQCSCLCEKMRVLTKVIFLIWYQSNDIAVIVSPRHKKRNSKFDSRSFDCGRRLAGFVSQIFFWEKSAFFCRLIGSNVFCVCVCVCVVQARFQ